MTFWNHMIYIGRIRDIINLTKSVAISNRIVVELTQKYFSRVASALGKDDNQLSTKDFAEGVRAVLVDKDNVLKIPSYKLAEECSFRKSMMTRDQFGLKNRVLHMMFATCVTRINLKLSTSPSIQ
ncbi:hypothetical protein L3X38_036026 [Prunus dulcis]|uniref:Uncharacterized protein n=1 Tax=Prunus dulcis TaxID=3755 RepID=A0AAD4V0P6_PRUDU|nr:hypothetical protein L3X38_036026 [Prunus dulcis]